MLNFQSDWTFLRAVAEYDKGEVVADTGGKNLPRWMVEDLGFEADPHAHETKYNYADVAYLHSQLGVKPSGNVGGFLFLPPDNVQGWEQHENGVKGRVYPEAFWKADTRSGAPPQACTRAPTSAGTACGGRRTVFTFTSTIRHGG